MKNVLIYTALPLNNATSVLHNDLIQVMHLISKIANITLVCTAKKLQKFYANNANNEKLKIVCKKVLIDTKDGSHIFKHDKSWINDLDDNYDLFLTWGHLSCSKNQWNKYLETLRTDDQFRVTFMSSLMHINPVVVIEDVMQKYNGIKMRCKITDYNEPDLTNWYNNVVMLGLYDDDKTGYKKIHDTEYCNFLNGFVDEKKTQDFVFGYTVTFAARKYLSEFVSKNIVESDKTKLFLKDNYWKPEKRDNLIPHDQYNIELAKSKWTLIAPSTVVTHFSIERFNEAIIRKCLPIFMEQVKYEHVFGEELCKFISDNLTFRQAEFSSLHDFIAARDYSQICKDFYNLQEIQQHLDPAHLEQLLFEEFALA